MYLYVEIYLIEKNKRVSHIIMSRTVSAWFRTMEVKYFHYENRIKNDVACCMTHVVFLSIKKKKMSNF